MRLKALFSNVYGLFLGATLSMLFGSFVALSLGISQEVVGFTFAYMAIVIYSPIVILGLLMMLLRKPMPKISISMEILTGSIVIVLIEAYLLSTLDSNIWPYDLNYKIIFNIFFILFFMVIFRMIILFKAAKKELGDQMSAKENNSF